MSKYTTGEVASLCGITVRTVQYYDKRGILVPSEISEGGRRLYSEDDVSQMRIICFLREIGIGIKEIGDFIDDPNSTEVMNLILEEQKKRLVSETREKEAQLKKIEELQRGLRNSIRLNDGNFKFDSIGDVVNVMKSKSKLRKIRGVMLGVGLPLDIIEVIVIVYGIKTGSWWPAILCIPLIAVVALYLVKFYYKNVLYICPNCHNVFRPGMKEFFLAGHTPTTRKLKCPECEKTSYCVETAECTP